MTLTEWRKTIEKALSQAGFENASLEAKWLLEGALQRSSTLNPTYTPHPEEEEHIQEWLARRLQGEPLSRIKGIREFWSLPFHIDEHTLDPRPETELIVEGVLAWIKKQESDKSKLQSSLEARKDVFKGHILDLGTGSGCLLISLLHELKNAIGKGIDMNQKALNLARSNSVLNDVEERATFLQGNWGDDLDEQFDIIVSNPPYIPISDRETLEKAVRDFDPPSALYAGEDGLDCYRILAHDIKRLLAPEGLAVLEVGYGQRSAVEKIFSDVGLHNAFVLNDLAGIERVIGFIRAEGSSAKKD